MESDCSSEALVRIEQVVEAMDIDLSSLTSHFLGYLSKTERLCYLPTLFIQAGSKE